MNAPAASGRAAALAPALDQARAFWAWWTAELAAMLPAALRPAPPPVLLAEALPGDGRFAFARLVRGARHPAGPEEAARLPTCLLLPEALVLDKEAEWPLMPEADLRRAVRLDLDRQTPFPAEALWFDVVPMRADPARRRVVARLLVARAAEVEAALARLRAAHGVAQVARVAVASPGGAIAGALRPAAAQAAPQAAGRGRLRAWLLAACLLLGGLNLVLHLDAEARRAERLDAAVAEARARVQRVEALRTRIAEQRRLRDEILGGRAGVPMLALLDELTRRIPDGAWLDGVELRGGQVQLTGQAPAAVGLVAALEASPLFAEAQFRAPVTLDRASGRERFDMVLRLRDRP